MRHKMSARCLAFARGGELLISAGTDHHMKIWNMPTIPEDEQVFAFDGRTRVVRWKAVPEDLLVVLGGAKQGIAGWDSSLDKAMVPSFRPTVYESPDPIMTLEWSFFKQAEPRGQPKTIGDLITRSVIRAGGPVEPKIEQWGTRSVSPHAPRVASIRADGILAIEDTSSGDTLLELDLRGSGPLRGVSFSPSGHLLAALVGTEVRVWNAIPFQPQKVVLTFGTAALR
jgi:WD40 repeat protein